MQKLLYHNIICLLYFIIIENSANNLYDKELSKYSQTPNYFIQMMRSPDVIINQFALNNTRMKGESSNMSIPPHVKKQDVNGVSQKQYEVINMLWRKTKIFVDIEASTIKYRLRNKTSPRKSYTTVHRNPFLLSFPRPLAQISTPSYIEFYYIHEIDDQVKEEKKSPNFNIDIRIAAKSGIKNYIEFIPRKSLYGFSNNYKHGLITPHPQFSHNKVRQKDNFIYYVDFFNHQVVSTLLNKSKSNVTKTANKNKYPKMKVTSFDILFGNETCPYTTLQNELNSENIDTSVNTIDKNKYQQESQTFHRKIKSPEKNEITYRKILLENVDQNTEQGHNIKAQNKTKKHVEVRVKAKAINYAQDKHVKKESKLSTILFNSKMNYNTESLNVSPIFKINSKYANPKTACNFVNSSASWSEYRFVAVYVYEPLQVYCDAAGISPHWLITAGSCLARHHKNPGGDGLSAYVTYCGDNWWIPERVSYVKFSLVHPRYHPRNKIRRHLYNIGIIQVVNSMVSACPGWSPISLMSHHFSANSVGPRATAVGWGLDRFDARYTFTDLPKRPLMMYDALVYSDSCPGNIGYSKAKQLEDEGGVRNVYCLSLPPYNGEENDPVHGSLLLVGEKLIALYLQEERRPWGEQSALYTGTWRLVPWVLDNARESDDSDIFTVDI